MAFYQNEYDTGYVKEDGKDTPLFTITITLAEYRDLIARASANETMKLVLENARLRDENAALKEKVTK